MKTIEELAQDVAERHDARYDSSAMEALWLKGHIAAAITAAIDQQQREHQMVLLGLAFIVNTSPFPKEDTVAAIQKELARLTPAQPYEAQR